MTSSLTAPAGAPSGGGCGARGDRKPVFQDFRYALRTLARSPGLSLAAVLTLGLGIGANSAMFGVVDRLFFRPPAHVVDPDRVVRVYVTTTSPLWGSSTTPIGTYPRYADLRDRARSFAAVAAYGGRTFSLGLGPQAEPVTGRLVTASFFSVLGVRPELGRFFGADEDSVGRAAHVEVLSREFWVRRFGADRAVLGKTLQLGRNVYTVIGVTPQAFAGIDLEVPDVWLPLTAVAAEVIGPDALGPRYYWLSGVVARLRPGVNPGQAAAEATATAGLEPRVMLFAAVAVLVTVVLAGFAPAYHASTPDLSSALKSGEREGTFQRSPVRTGLLVGQVALTLVLLAGAGLFVSSLRHVQGLRLGFDADRLIVASVDLQRLGYKRAAANALYEDMRERVKRLPGVSGASLAVGHPFCCAFVVTLFVPGLDSLPQAPSGGPYFEAVTPDYFRTMGAAMRRGRALVPTDIAGAQRVAVVNETMARRYWPGQDPLGKCLKIISPATPCTEVVGVVEDARLNSVTDEGGAIQYFIPLAQADSVTSSPVTALLVRTNGPADALVGAVRRTVQETAVDLPYPSIDPMPRLFASQLRPWRLGSILLSLFGALGLVLSAIGLYGVHSYVVSQRTQEVGIRIALGAGRREILELIMGQALRVTGWGLVLGAAGALEVGRAIASLLYGVKPHDPLVLSLVMVILGAVAAVASYLPARRATKVDPMVALRYE